MTRPAPHCCKCNAVIFSDAEKISKADRGGRAAYICLDCLEATSESNEATRGTSTAAGYKYISVWSIEDAAAAITAELLTYEWTRAPYADPREGCYISPKLNSLKPLPKKAATIERLADQHGSIWTRATLEIYPAQGISETADKLAHRAAYEADEAGEYLHSTINSEIIEYRIEYPTADSLQALTRYAKKTAQAIERAAAAVDQGKTTEAKAVERVAKAMRKAYEAEPHLLIY